MRKAWLLGLALVGALGVVSAPGVNAQSLQEGFFNPPDSAKPLVQWYWMSGNITADGITQDLHAMKQAGLAGAWIYNTDDGIPRGPVDYLSPEWLKLIAQAAREANELGLELGVHNCSGRSSSGGPWVKPEQSMKRLVWTETRVDQPGKLAVPLATPRSIHGYYADVATLAFPVPPAELRSKVKPARIDNFAAKAGWGRLDNGGLDNGPNAAADAVVKLSEVQNLTDKLKADGTLDWEAPAGHWIILRFGQTSTGSVNLSAVPGSVGLEVDKLSREACDQFWKSGVDPILSACGQLTGKSLKTILIDSYERGYQTWTDKFTQEFQSRRGYSLVPWLPAMAGYVVATRTDSERFLWDVRRTQADLWNDNYYGRFAENAHAHNLLLGANPHGNGGFDNLTAGGKADTIATTIKTDTSLDEQSAREVASTAHTYGANLVNAEVFFARWPRTAWSHDPWSLKTLGDREWCAGVNRFAIHGYALQPWPNVVPGMTMGGYGVMFNRATTWWDQASAWTGYLARCQFLLQSGHSVSDILYFTGDNGQNSLLASPEAPDGYGYDGVDPVVLQRLTVKDGRLTLPGGPSYRILVLPAHYAMLPATLKKVGELLTAGATVYANSKPLRSPSLQDQPQADGQVQRLVDSLWGDLDGKTVTERTVGAGRLVWGKPLADVLTELKTPPDCTFAGNDADVMHWIHRASDDADIYFLANVTDSSVTVAATFRGAHATFSDEAPELWHGDTQVIEPAPLWKTANGLTTVNLDLAARASVFVVFRKTTGGAVNSPRRHDSGVFAVDFDATAAQTHKLVIQRAEYGWWNVQGSIVDVTRQVGDMVAKGTTSIPASTTDLGIPDPASNIVKKLEIVYTLNGERKTLSASEGQKINLPADAKLEKATYGAQVTDKAQIVDVTNKILAKVKNGWLIVVADNAIAGDPAPQKAKELRVQYLLDSEPKLAVAAEGVQMTLPEMQDGVSWSPYNVTTTADGRPLLIAWLPGTATLTDASGAQRKLTVAGPASQRVDGPWTVNFPDGAGAPKQTTFPALTSWDKSEVDSIRYFSGTAEYVKTVQAPADWLTAGRRIRLSLGDVKTIVQLSINGQPLPTLWKPPFVYDLTGKIRAGDNELRIRVTNTWINRLIGDEKVADPARTWNNDGLLLAWPKSMIDNHYTPVPIPGRHTWTSLKPYNAESPLQPAGLLGPVYLQLGVETPMS